MKGMTDVREGRYRTYESADYLANEIIADGTKESAKKSKRKGK
jgi:hypothetical protein